MRAERDGMRADRDGMGWDAGRQADRQTGWDGMPAGSGQRSGALAAAAGGYCSFKAAS